MTKLSVGSIDIPETEIAYLKAVVGVSDVSLRKHISTSIEADLAHNRKLYADRIDSKARQLNLTWEETFYLYSNFSYPFSVDQIKEAKQAQPIVYQAYGLTSPET